LAARTLIRELEDEAAEHGTQRGSRQRRGQPDRLTAEIIRLGTTYQLCSSHTSFVAIERRETPTEGDLQLRKVPVQLTHGWGGAEPARPVVSCAAPPTTRTLRRICSPEIGRIVSDVRGNFGEGDELVRVAQAAPRPLDRLILLQAADGSWDLTEDLADICGCSLPFLEDVPRKTSGDAATVRRAWATALALAFLETHADDVRDEWALLAAKARRWLQRCGVDCPTGQPWIVLARHVLVRM
jgi:hypothetical protein